LCDFVVHTLVGDADFKQRMLETLDAAERLRQTVSRFRREADLLKLQKRLQGGLADDGIPSN
jgi:ATP-dependent Lon protease